LHGDCRRKVTISLLSVWLIKCPNLCLGYNRPFQVFSTLKLVSWFASSVLVFQFLILKICSLNSIIGCFEMNVEVKHTYITSV
jgi:hypothetical protein